MELPEHITLLRNSIDGSYDVLIDGCFAFRSWTLLEALESLYIAVIDDIECS